MEMDLLKTSYRRVEIRVKSFILLNTGFTEIYSTTFFILAIKVVFQTFLCQGYFNTRIKIYTFEIFEYSCGKFFWNRIHYTTIILGATMCFYFWFRWKLRKFMCVYYHRWMSIFYFVLFNNNVLFNDANFLEKWIIRMVSTDISSIKHRFYD